MAADDGLWTGLSANTRRAYDRHAQAWEEHRRLHRIDGSHVEMALWLSALADAGASRATLDQAIAALTRICRLEHPEGPPLGHHSRAAALLEKAKRTAGGTEPRQAPPLMWHHVDQICDSIEAEAARYISRDLEPLRALCMRDLAMIRIASDCLLRASELIAIRHRDLTDYGLRLPRSKTDQRGHGVDMWLSDAARAALEAWMLSQGSPRLSDVPLFTWDGIAPGRRQTTSMLRSRARAAGLPDLPWTVHSLRRGAAQSLVAAGASFAQVMQAGRWKTSETAIRYIRVDQPNAIVAAHRT